MARACQQLLLSILLLTVTAAATDLADDPGTAPSDVTINTAVAVAVTATDAAGNSSTVTPAFLVATSHGDGGGNGAGGSGGWGTGNGLPRTGSDAGRARVWAGLLLLVGAGAVLVSGGRRVR